MAQPLSILVETFGTNTVSNETIEQAVREVFDLRPGAIVRDLDLKKPGLQAHRRLRPLRPPRLHVGRHQPARRVQGRRRPLSDRSTPARRDSIGGDRRPGAAERHRARQGVRLSRSGRRSATLARRRPRPGRPARPAHRRLGRRARSRDALAVDELKPIAKVTGRGPSPELIELAGWAAIRWAGRRRHFLHAASPDRAVTALPARRNRTGRVVEPRSPASTRILEAGGGVLRLPADQRPASRRS